MRVMLLAVMLQGCTTMPNSIDVIEEMDMDKPIHVEQDMATTDMVETVSPDMENTFDMLVEADMAEAPDLLEPADLMPAPDLSPVCNAPFSNCGGYCVNKDVDNNNCGGCGVKCTNGAICSAGQCKYKHHNTFCVTYVSTGAADWYDTNPTVDPTNSTQAQTACNACCAAATGAQCPCAQGQWNNGLGYDYHWFFNWGSESVRFYVDTSPRASLIGIGYKLNANFNVVGSAYWSQ